MGGINFCRSHCHVAKFRGLMHERKNSAVIGRKTRFMYVPNITFRAMGALEPITALHFSPYSYIYRELLLNRGANHSGRLHPVILLNNLPRPADPSTHSRGAHRKQNIEAQLLNPKPLTLNSKP